MEHKASFVLQGGHINFTGSNGISPKGIACPFGYAKRSVACETINCFRSYFRVKNRGIGNRESGIGKKSPAELDASQSATASPKGRRTPRVYEALKRSAPLGHSRLPIPYSRYSDRPEYQVPFLHFSPIPKVPAIIVLRTAFKKLKVSLLCVKVRLFAFCVCHEF